MSFYKQMFLAVGASVLVAAAAADPITFTFSGTGTISENGDTTLSGPFSFVFTADTTAVTSYTSGSPLDTYYKLANVSGTFTDGSFSATLAPSVSIVENQTEERINFYNAAFNNGLGLIAASSAFSGYTLASTFGPLSVPGGVNLFNNTIGVPGSSFALSGGGTIDIIADDTLTFSSSVSAVPESGTYALLAAGLLLVGWKIRRHTRASFNLRSSATVVSP